MDARTLFGQVDLAYQTLPPEQLEQRLRDLTQQAAEETGAASALHASMLGELGGYYRGQRRYAASEDCFCRALDILTDRLGPDHPDRTTMLNNLAGTWRLMGKFAEAEQAFRTCLDSYGRTLGTGHILYASGLNNLSLLYLDQNDYPRAAACLAQASEILSTMPDNREDYATSLCNLAGLHYGQGCFAQAEQEAASAAAIYETELGTRTPHYHAALSTLAAIRRKRGNHAGAKQAMEQAVAAAKSLFGEHHPEYLQLLQTLPLFDREDTP